jgi:hypothetical protein
MSKGARVITELDAGTRVPNGQRWKQVPDGMRMVIPTFMAVQAGAKPFVIPIPVEERIKQPADPILAKLPLGDKPRGGGGYRLRGSNRTESQASKRKRRRK